MVDANASALVLTPSHVESLAALSDEVSGRLKVVCWSLGDADAVERLCDGIEVGESEIHLFSDEWIKRQAQVAGFVRARAGLFDRRVGARSCDLREVPREEAARFLDSFHIQGSNNLGIVCFGLYADGEPVGLLSMGRHSRQIAENRIVLDRLCFKSGVQVVGGVSKLVAAAVEWARCREYDEIVTFSDSRWTGGEVYGRNGFSVERLLRPDYCYAKDGARFSKQSQKKDVSKCPDGMTEFEWASARGLARIYDAGKRRWVLNLRPDGHRTRNELSAERCAKQHREGVFMHSHMRGHFDSAKNGAAVYFGSSYELRCIFLLESDPAVAAFRRCDAFRGAERWRNPDLWVEFSDGHAEVWEVKPVSMLSHPAVVEQLHDSVAFAGVRGVGFRVWTERDSGLKGDHEIVDWAKRYLRVEAGDTGHDDRRKESRRRTRRRYYDRRIASDRVDVWCDYCQETHRPLRLTYTKNMERNEKYVCERYGGHLAGKSPKPKKENPYEADGMKQCTGCLGVKPLDAFYTRRASRDGKSFKCKPCTDAIKARRRIVTGAVVAL